VIPRLLALLAAIGMIAGAVVIRNRMNDDEAIRNEILRLVCATELEEACRTLEGREDIPNLELTVEDAGRTFTRLTSEDRHQIDGWLTLAPLPQAVQELRRLGGKPATIVRVSAPIASARIGVVAWKARSSRMQCAPGVGWRCIGEAAGQPWASVGGQPEWGPVKTALPDPANSASGLVVLGAATVGFFGRADVGSADLEDDLAFAAWFERLARNNRSVDLNRMLAVGPAEVDFVACLEPETRVIAGSARRNDVGVIYPAPVARADVVLGTSGSARSARLADLVREGGVAQALREAGWKTPGAGDANLPSPGLLSVLRERWAA
jgi:hypothetical protein